MYAKDLIAILKNYPGEATVEIRITESDLENNQKSGYAIDTDLEGTIYAFAIASEHCHPAQTVEFLVTNPADVPQDHEGWNTVLDRVREMNGGVLYPTR